MSDCVTALPPPESSRESRAWFSRRLGRCATALCALTRASPSAARELDRLALPEPTYRRPMTALPIEGGAILARASIAPDVVDALAYLREGPTYNRTVAALARDAARPLEIHPAREPADPASFADPRAGTNEYDPATHRIFWNPRQGVREYHADARGILGCRPGSAAAVLGHELLHALECRIRPARGAARAAIGDPVFGSADERAIARATTRANREIGEPPMRNHDCDFVATSGPRERGEACVAPAVDEDALIARRLRSVATTTAELREGEAARRDLVRAYGPPPPEFAALARVARTLYARASHAARGGASYAALRPRIDAFMDRALRATRDYPRVASLEPGVELRETAHRQGG